MQEEYLTTNELAKRIKMAPGSIRNLVSQGTLKRNVHYLKPTPRKILFVWSAINDWLYGKTPMDHAHNGQKKSRKNGLIHI